MKQQQLLQGQYVVWFRFNKTGTTVDPVYDTGPQRAWYPGITLPVYSAEYFRADQNYDDDGLYQTDRAELIFSHDAFFHTTMPDPDPNGADHVNDRVAFDGHLFSVDSFIPKGRVADYFLTVTAQLLEVAQSDLDEDASIALFAPYLVVADG